MHHHLGCQQGAASASIALGRFFIDGGGSTEATAEEAAEYLS